MKLTENVSARISPGERRALEELQRRRAEQLAARGEPPDATTAGWLRAVIRREAKAAKIKIVEEKVGTVELADLAETFAKTAPKAEKKARNR